MSARFRQTFAGLLRRPGDATATRPTADNRDRDGGVLFWGRPGPCRAVRAGGDSAAAEDGGAAGGVAMRPPTSDVSGALATWNVTTADPEPRNSLELVEINAGLDATD